MWLSCRFLLRLLRGLFLAPWRLLAGGCLPPRGEPRGPAPSAALWQGVCPRLPGAPGTRAGGECPFPNPAQGPGGCAGPPSHLSLFPPSLRAAGEYCVSACGVGLLPCAAVPEGALRCSPEKGAAGHWQGGTWVPGSGAPAWVCTLTPGPSGVQCCGCQAFSLLPCG